MSNIKGFVKLQFYTVKRLNTIIIKRLQVLLLQENKKIEISGVDTIAGSQQWFSYMAQSCIQSWYW